MTRETAPKLMDYRTGETIRDATEEEVQKSEG
jgi:hypothetical protein